VSGANQTSVSELALQVVAKRAGTSASATEVAAVARRTYEDLSEVAAPLIGRLGIEALMSRAAHLARRQYPWLGSDRPDSPQPEENAFAEVARCLEQAEAALAADAAAAVFARSAALLVTLIGDGLTASLLYKAWPDALPVPSNKRSDNE
jgi:hypothetical protein